MFINNNNDNDFWIETNQELQSTVYASILVILLHASCFNYKNEV